MKPLIFSVLLLFSFSGMAQHKATLLKIDFEKKSMIRMDSMENNIWQIGQTPKYPSDAARTISNAIVTDTIQPYPVNNHSSFQLSVPVDKKATYASLQLWHKFDMDTLEDFGKIEVSYDGDSWRSIRKFPALDFPVNNNKSYGKDKSDIVTGKSNGWASLFFKWHWSEFYDTSAVSNNVPDTIRVRFSFFSDARQNNKQGWLIDEILIEQVEMVPDSCLPKMSRNYPSPYPQTKAYTFNGVNYGANIRIESYEGNVLFEDRLSKALPLIPILLPSYPAQTHHFLIKTGTGFMYEKVLSGR